MDVLKNKTKLEIKNVICFYVGEHYSFDTYDELKHKKEGDWSYQDYLTDACGKNEYNLVFLNKDKIMYTFENGILSINDLLSDNKFSLNADNIHDTIIFQGQANEHINSVYIGLMKALEYMGFLMFNTIDEIEIASDKFLSANLLSSKDIPQPHYAIITKQMVEDENGIPRDSFNDILNSIYTNEPNISNVGESRKFVVKTLGGSLGIGVFICNETEILGILQTLFAINEDLELIIQEFCDNTGDIRVHMFSVDGVNYEVLAAMKRNKISGDFRSNVSLGATTDEYKLSKEQEEIVHKVASLSGCRWVGVDLMECKDGRNVVIEYNSSPGVQGISKQIKKNMFSVVFDKINDYLKKYAIYWTDKFHYGEDRGKCFTQYDPDIIEKLKNEWEGLSTKRKKVLNKCLTIQPGTYYKLHGKKCPNMGLDCSGYNAWIFKETINAELPKICAGYFTIFSDSDWEQIDKDELQPGDIGVKNESTILNHCGIYAGDNKWFETNYLHGVQLTNYKEFKHFFRIKNID